MFSQLFFVLLILTLINFTPSEGLTFWVQDPQQALLWGLAGYAALLALIFWQTKYLYSRLKSSLQPFWWPLINVELLLFFSIYHFGLGAQRFFQQGDLASYQSPATFASLILYFLAYGWAQMWVPYFHFKRKFKKSLKSSLQQLLFFIPFCIPFAVISLMIDGLELLPGWNAWSNNHPFILMTLGGILLLLVIIFLPVCMKICWRCKPLKQGDLKVRLETLCKEMNFSHACLNIWTSMAHEMTAGIIGVVSSFRYILFTPLLLQRFEPEEIEAILVHEIGHHRYKHLLLYPFIMLGMVLTGALLLAGLEKGIQFWIDPIETQTEGGETGYFTLLIFLFTGYALAIGLYFRLIFGFFSRLFERQADLHIFDSPLSPSYMINALDRLGVVTGHSHKTPSWHHDSLDQRIQFLNKAMDNRALIKQHHRKVKKWLLFYFFGLVLCSIALYTALG